MSWKDSIQAWATEKVDFGFGLVIPNWLFWPIFMSMIIAIIVLLSVKAVRCCKCSNFENKDLYGNSIRFLQRRDDTGSVSTSLEERQAN